MMNKISKEFEDNFAREYLINSTIEGLKSINDKLSVVKSDSGGDIKLYIESYRIFGFTEDEAIKLQFSQSISRIVYRRIGTIIQELIYKSFKCSKKFNCGSNIKFNQLLLKDNVIDKIRINEKYLTKEAGDIILFDKKYSYEVKWSFATTAGNELEMILSKAELCNKIKYMPILLIFTEPIPDQARKSYQKLKEKFQKYGSVYEKKQAWDHIKEMTNIDLRNIFENHLENMYDNHDVKEEIKRIYEKTQIS